MRMCKRPKIANFRGAGRSSNRDGLRRVNLFAQTAEKSEGCSEWDKDNVVLRLYLTGFITFVLKERINKQPFTTMIDSRLPIIFTKEVVRKISKK